MDSRIPQTGHQLISLPSNASIDDRSPWCSVHAWRVRWTRMVSTMNFARSVGVGAAPPPVVAELLGYSYATVQRHAEVAAEPWGSYVASRPPTAGAFGPRCSHDEIALRFRRCMQRGLAPSQRSFLEAFEDAEKSVDLLRAKSVQAFGQARSDAGGDGGVRLRPRRCEGDA